MVGWGTGLRREFMTNEQTLLFDESDGVIMARGCFPGLTLEMGTLLEERALTRRQSGDRPFLVLDLSNVMYLGEAELAILLQVRDKVDACQGQFVLVGLRSHCLDLAMVSELARQFELHPTVKDALKALKTAGARKSNS